MFKKCFYMILFFENIFIFVLVVSKCLKNGAQYAAGKQSHFGRLRSNWF